MSISQKLPKTIQKSKPTRETRANKISKPSQKPLFHLAYVILALITGAAIATPPASAANLLPNSNIGAMTMIASVAILMLVLVVEIWRQTGKKTGPRLQAQMIAVRKRRHNYFD